MKELKNNKGITLIALVITIIVLLILAGVSISAITGENGIVQKAQEAKDATRAAKIEEKLSLYQTENILSAELEEESKSIEEFIDELENENLITKDEKALILENHELTIGNQKTITFPFGKTLVQAFKDGEIQIGDYVSYTPSDLSAIAAVKKVDTGVAGTQTFSVDTATTWRVLGLNEEGTNLLLISGSPIKTSSGNHYLELSGGEAYFNGIDTLNKISSIYHNENLAVETRSITAEDINNALGIVLEGNLVYKKSDENKTNLNQYTNSVESYTYKDGDWAINNYLKATYPDDEEIQALETTKIGDVVYGNAYMYEIYEGDIVDRESAIFELLFKEAESIEDYVGDYDGMPAFGTVKFDKPYWVASRGISVSATSCYFGLGSISGGETFVGSGVKNVDCGMSSGNGYYERFERGVRPVVVLKSNVTIDQILLTTGSEEEWDTMPSYVAYGHGERQGVLTATE